jgi:hypothetical protein
MLPALNRALTHGLRPGFGLLDRAHGKAYRGQRETWPAWAIRIQDRYLVLERDEWEARGRGYRGALPPARRMAGPEAAAWRAAPKRMSR